MQSPEQILAQYWGYKTFRPGQKEIIDNILAGRDTLALLPTGGGKSLCYQIPALASEGFCLVVSPLIALMQDQVAKLKSLGILADCIHAGLHYNDVKRILGNMLHGPYKLLYVSPERLQTDLFLEFLPEFNISFIAIDEAHCVSQWGHDFRPDYLKIASLRKVFSEVPILALTASATPEVRDDITRQLALRQSTLFLQSFERTNIFYDVRYTENKNRDVIDAIKESTGSNIIYCRSRRQTEMLTKYLQQQDIPATFYHAGMKKDKREAAQSAWMNNEVRTMIATTAFGMGIDKPDVRYVMHYDAPGHLEAYYQEAGRAGRDGQAATALTLFNKTDIKRLQDSTELQYPPESYLRQVYQAVAEYLQIPISAEPHRYYPFDLQDFSKKFGLEALPASNALKILEREGLWTISDTVFNPSTIYFTATRQELDNLSVTYPDLGYVATGLLRLYGTLFAYPTVINIMTVAKQLRLKKELAEQLITKLQEMEILEYRKPLEASQMFFHHYRVDSRHLIIDIKRITGLKKRHEKRTDAMLRFLQSTVECRSRMMLAYFGEETDIDCGHCDICRTKYKQSNFDEAALRNKISEKINNAPVHINDIVKELPAIIKERATALIRAMVDEGSIKLSANGYISGT